VAAHEPGQPAGDVVLSPRLPVQILRSYTLALLPLAALVIVWHSASAHVRAASLLVRFADPDGHSLLGDVSRHPVEVRELAVPETRARLYLPTDVAHPPGIVLLHGVHYKGIDEPRLQRFARTIAASGTAVLTPEVRELCDYRIDPASIETIGVSTGILSRHLGGRRVGVMGFSFAGGLSLVAATDSRYRGFFAFVVAVGAHDDLGRVLRFFTSNEAPRPDGSTMHLTAHAYGPAVLVYSHVEDFFRSDEVGAARDALRLWLHEDFDAARERATVLSSDGAAEITHVFDRDTAALAGQLNAEIARLEHGFAAVSPSAHMRDIQVPVFLLHGAGDTVIPPSETEWLARDTPRRLLRDVLVSRAIEHVELQGGTKLGDELALVHFMSDVLEATDDLR
jgi:pimeloyl-ACP methyl ester carboxylesterase